MTISLFYFFYVAISTFSAHPLWWLVSLYWYWCYYGVPLDSSSHPSPVVTVTRLFEGYLRGRPQFKPKPRWNDSNQRFQYDSRLYYSGFLTKNPIVLGSLSWKFWCPAEIAWIEPASGKWITRIIRCHSPLLSHNDTVLLR